MTTTPRDRALRVEGEIWVDGRLEKPSYVSPWFAMTVKHADISHRVGTLSSTLVNEAIAALVDCLGTNASTA